MNGRNSGRAILVCMVFILLLAVPYGPLLGPQKVTVSECDVPTDEANLSTSTRDIAQDLGEIDSHYFTENLGQWEEHIKYSAKTGFGYVGLSDDGVYYYLVEEEIVTVVKIKFLDGEKSNPRGEGDMGFSSNYFYGNDATKWVSGARSYMEVIYYDVWPGIDVIYHFKDNQFKYDIIISEFSDPDVISFGIEGHRDLKIYENGIEIYVSNDIQLTDTDLFAYYENGDPAPCAFKKVDDKSYGFEVQKEYGRKLTIDPVVLSISTLLGGSGGEIAHDITTDSAGNIIVVGGTGSSDYPNTTGAVQNFFAGAFDVVVTKMNPDLTDIIFSTYLGDWSTDYGYGVEVDENDDIYITGMTYSWYYPTTNGSFQEEDPSMGMPDAFVTKLASEGNQLLYSTYVGGTSSDTAYDIKVLNGEAYVVGNALSYDFPANGASVGDAHGTIFFFIMNHNGTNLTNSAFWGGFSNEFGYSLYIDNNDDVVVGGVSYSDDFPTTAGAYMATVNDTANGVLLKYRPSTSSLIFSTYIGADASDNVHSVYVDDMGDIYFTGITAAPSGGNPYPTTSGAFDRFINGGNDIFITKMDPMGTGLIYSTYFGGDGDEDPGRIDVDENGNVILSGKTTSDVNFSLTSDCFDDTYGGDEDAFFMILNNIGTNLIYSTYLGGSAYDAAEACMVTSTKDVLVFGSSSSSEFPVTSGSYQTTNKGNSDLFITKFNVGNKMYLQKGWNFISVPLIQSDTSLASVLSSINGYYDAVQWYDPNDPQDP
jgi:hypothetical protein